MEKPLTIVKFDQTLKKMYIQEKDLKKIRIIQNGKLVNITKDYIRTWVDRQDKPLKCEFRGEYNGYLDINEILIT